MNISGDPGMSKQKIDILQIIEQRKNKKFAFNLIAWLFLLMIMMAIDITAASYTAPILIKGWGVNPKQFSLAFSAALAGIMVGGVVFGALGDRIGRKKSLMISVLWISVFTLACSMADSLTTYTYLRFITGLGLGGAVPLAIVLVNEYAPMRSRGKWVAIMFTGFPLGSSIGGMLGAWLVPAYGWQSIYILGGIVPVLLTIGIFFKLPESLKFLVVKNKDRSEITKIISLLEPGLSVPSDAEFFLKNEEKNVHFSPKRLFAGSLLIITPLLWVLYILNSAAIYFFSSWLPQVFVSSGLALKEASLATSVYHIAGLICGISVGWLFDKRGILACILFPVIASIMCTLLGLPAGGTLMFITIFTAGFFVIGSQNVLTIMTPTLYPTSFRSKGIGIAMSIAKIGSIIGPIMGGVLLSAKLPIEKLFLINSGVFLVSAALLMTIGLVHRRYSKETENSVSNESIEVAN